MVENSFDIVGMTCSACAAHVQKAVGKLNGVESSEVNITTEKMTVRYDESMLGFDDFKKAVEDAGYGIVEPKSPDKKIELGVDGMTCAACSAAVERVTKKLEGVHSSSVNLTTNRVSLEYDPAKVKLSEIKEAISGAGYSPREIEAEDLPDLESEQHAREVRGMRNRLIVSIVFAALILYFAMPHMFSLNLPIPAFIDPHMFPLRFAIAQLILTIPVLVAGSRFYRVGFRTLFKGAPNMDTLVAIGTGSAFLYSTYAAVMIYLGDAGFIDSLYFESAAVVVTLVMVGKYLEAVSKGKTSEAIKKLMRLRPKVAIVIKDGVEMEVPLDEVAVGDIVLVRPGTAVTHRRRGRGRCFFDRRVDADG